jgi:hypothetical protein
MFSLLPKAIAISMSTVILLYLLINCAYCFVMGVDGILSADNIVDVSLYLCGFYIFLVILGVR